MESSTMTNSEKFPREKRSRSELRNSSSVDDKQQASIEKKRKFPDNFADGAAVCTMTNFEKFPGEKRSRSELRNVSSVDDKQQASIGKKKEFPDTFADGAAACISKKSKAASTVNGVCEDGDLRRTNRQMDATKKKQCGIVLRKLMTRRSCWLFNDPVDPVKLKIPDYFEVIPKPMDLGTIKNKLERELYSSTSQFAADVKLTFSNAMTYNPPSDSVHIKAKELNNAFNLEWKSLESKWENECLAATEILVTNGAQKRTVAAKPVTQRASSCNIATSAEKLKLQKQLEKFPGGIPPQLLKLLPKSSLHGQDKDTLGVDIEKLDEETFKELQKKLRSFADARTTKSEGIREKQSQTLKGDFLKDVGSEKSSDIKKFARHSIASKLDSKNTITGTQKDYSSLDANGCAIDGTAATAEPSPHPSGPAAIPTKEEDAPPCEEQLSPRALRAKELRKRFAVTISRAEQNKLMDNGEKRGSERNREWEEAEKQQREVRLRIKAKMEADRKTQTERAREASRLKMQNMQKTVDIDENIGLLRELEKLGLGYLGR